MKHVAFFYDFSCPYAYLAHQRVDGACLRQGATVTWKPFLLGGVFRAIGTPDVPATEMAPAKAKMNFLDMHRWADVLGVPLEMPATHPNRTVLALRATLASSDPVAASKALFAAYWGHGRDVSQPETVRAALDGAGLDGAACVAKAEDPAVKDALKRATDEAIAAGVFGAPAFVVTIRDEPGRRDAVELFWGQDRLQLVEEMLAGEPHGDGAGVRQRDDDSGGAAPRDEGAGVRPRVGEPHNESAGARRPQRPKLEFHFDFSSPFAYLAATQVQRLAERAGADLDYKPFLLGGLFRAIGTANVPLFTMPEAKQRHAGADMRRWAAHWGVPFSFPSRFPMNTVKALRLVLAAEPASRPRLTDAIFHAYWAEDRDISDPSVLVRVATRAGLDGAALAAQTSSDEIRAALQEATDLAAQRGIFGAPSFFAGDLLFWGQDRLDLVEKALGGWRPRGE